MVLWIALWGSWVWISYESISNEITTVYDNMEYDYIIVGGGTAGCVLANRLSFNQSVTVLLIEAGRLFGPLSIIPVTTTMMQGTNVDWSFKTVPQKYSSKGLFNNQQILPRGKGLGGSSQLNYMLHFDGNERDFNEWESKIGKLWGFDELKKYINDLYGNCAIKNANSLEENCSVDEFEKSIADVRELSEFNLANILEDAGTELDYDGENITIHVAKYNIKNGKRYSVFHQYLQPIYNRPNLHILTNTRVHKVSFIAYL